MAFRLSAAEVSIRREGSCLLLEPVEIERDEKGWPRAFWELAGSAPDFDLGDRRRTPVTHVALSVVTEMPLDLMIAAQAVAQKATLVSNNLKEFRRIRGLRCEDWTI